MPRAPLAQFAIALAVSTLAVTAFNAMSRHADRIRDAENAKAELAVARQEARTWILAHPVVIEEAKR